MKRICRSLFRRPELIHEDGNVEIRIREFQDFRFLLKFVETLNMIQEVVRKKGVLLPAEAGRITLSVLPPLNSSGISVNSKIDYRLIGHKKHKETQEVSVRNGVCRNAVTL